MSFFCNYAVVLLLVHLMLPTVPIEGSFNLQNNQIPYTGFNGGILAITPTFREASQKMQNRHTIHHVYFEEEKIQMTPYTAPNTASSTPPSSPPINRANNALLFSTVSNRHHHTAQ